ncbi:FHA domain-containing protein [Hyalangium rubrum]|uniref:FHA domain-containing protein n=1 Tax=Hyalangium rubrum TaxID=3103134 RepID=A0ABU5H423_9BACT|nr:FHA domain-containing protein [Hyalangium sp. s54d21]MDY7227872.1 FHA domain-containing protein [Hyalangium sp. s54d21]
MDEVIFLEVLEGDSLHARHRLERFPVTVGRGYFNDVILDDPKVSAAHLRIDRTEEGALVLRDVGSQNGTFRVEPWAPLAELTLAQDSRVQVGDTVLRFRGRTYEVPHTLVGEAPVGPQQRIFERPWSFVSALGAAVGFSVLSSYVTSYDKTDWGEVVFSVLLPVALALFWAGGWSVASRIARRPFHFRAHGTIGSVVLLAVIGIPGVLTVLGFSLSLGPSLAWLALLGYLGVMGWGLFWHLRYVTRWDSRRLATMVTAVVLGFGLLLQAQELLGNEDFDTALGFPRTLLPSAFRLAPAASMDSFFEETAGLQEQVDALTKEP